MKLKKHLHRSSSHGMQEVASMATRRLVLEEGYRVDGRGVQDVRPIWSRASLPTQGSWKCPIHQGWKLKSWLSPPWVRTLSASEQIFVWLHLQKILNRNCLCDSRKSAQLMACILSGCAHFVLFQKPGKHVRGLPPPTPPRAIYFPPFYASPKSC